MQNASVLKEVVRQFDVPGRYVSHVQIRAGIINQTYLVTLEDDNGVSREYVFQKINTNVFREPYKVMENIIRVTEHIKHHMIEADGEYARRVLSFSFAKDGKPYFENDQLGFWRAYEYVDNSTAYNIAPSADHFFQAGYTFGKFQLYLTDYDATTLHETIPNFHHTVSRMKALHEAVENDVAGRLKDVRPELEFILAREAEAGTIVKALENGDIPWRVTHNDTKINNVLFDDATQKGLCVIDLDTVMPGSSLYDFGDAIRSGSCDTAEDEPDLNKVFMDLEKYRLFTKGFIKGTHCQLTEKEVELMPIGAKLMTLEVGTRFLTDYLNGDVYFHTDYSGQNLLRTRTQLKLVADMESKMDVMSAYAKVYYEQYTHRFAGRDPFVAD